MALGAYSIVRFANDLNDQRVNLGVIVWHPIDGFRFRFTPALDRAKAIDENIRTKSLEEQLGALGDELKRSGASTRGLLRSLSDTFREGLQVSSPYPARMHSVEGCLEEVYELLVSPSQEFRRSSSQRVFAQTFKKALGKAVKKVLPGATVDDIGVKQLNGVSVSVGLRVHGEKQPSLWHPLSLQSKNQKADQIAHAKSTAMDIVKIHEKLPEFNTDLNLVALQPPKAKSSEGLNDAMAWLRYTADEVLLFPSIEGLTAGIEAKLRALE